MAVAERAVSEVNEHPVRKKNRLALLLAACRRNFARVIRLLNAKIKLHSCLRVGSMVTVRGKLRVENQGTIIIGNRVKIWSHIGTTQVSVGENALLIIGDNTFINTDTIISVRHRIVIGKNCQIANQVIIMDNDFHGVENRDKPEDPLSIVIEDNVWLATRCTILKGVTIGQGAVVAAGAVVTRNVPAYTLVGGVPAKIIKYIQPA